MAVSKVILNGETLIDVTQKTVTPSNMLSGITALKNDGTDITGSIAAKSAADLVTSGSQVTVPSGMYAAAATTAVEAGWISLALGSTKISIDSGRFNIDDQTGIIYVNDGVTLTQTPPFIPGYISDVGYLELDVEATGSYQLPVKTASDLQAAGSVVTVPSGYYTADVSKAVASGSINLNLYSQIDLDSYSFNINPDTGVVYVNGGVISTGQPGFSSGYISDPGYYMIEASASGSYALPTRTSSDLSASGSVVTIPSGWYGTTASKAVAAGSITIPSHSFDIKPDITLDSATGKIDLWKSLSYTIPVSLTSGYITQASGPRVAATVDSSYQLPVKAAATIVPSTSDQVVASGYFLTGAQTIKGDSALIPSNIAAGISIFGIEGTHQGGGTLQSNKNVASSSSTFVVVPDSGYDGLEQVTVTGMPEMTVPDINYTISSNGKLNITVYTYRGYSPGYGINQSNQLATASGSIIVPSASSQIAVTSGKYTTGDIIVAAERISPAKVVNPSEVQQIILPDEIIPETPDASVPAGTSGRMSGVQLCLWDFKPSGWGIVGQQYYINAEFTAVDNTKVVIDGCVTYASNYCGDGHGGCYLTSITTVTGASASLIQGTEWWTGGNYEQIYIDGNTDITSLGFTTSKELKIYLTPFGREAGIAQVTVNAAALQSKVVTPSTEQQIITPDNSLYGIIPQGTVSEEPYPGWPALSGVYPPSPISVGTHVEGLIDIIYNTNKLGTIEINGDITESHFESICTLTAAPAYQSTLQLGNAVWDSDGLNFYLSLGGLSLVAATDIRFDSLPVYNYYGLSQVTVEAVAATTSYYLAQDSQGYITYSSIMPSGGEYYIFDVAGIKHIEGN